MDDGGGRWRRGREQKKTKIEGLINNSGAEEHYYLIRAEVQLYSDSKSVLYCLYLTENDVRFILKFSEIRWWNSLHIWRITNLAYLYFFVTPKCLFLLCDHCFQITVM